MKKHYINCGQLFTLAILLIISAYITTQNKLLVQAEEQVSVSVKEIVDGLTIEEKVGQMFIVRPEDQADFEVGGICIFGPNITSADAMRDIIRNQKEKSTIAPFIAVDEEGGRVSRVANSDFFGLRKYKSMEALGRYKNPEVARIVAAYIGGYLSELGYNLDFAPVADVNTNPDNPVIGERAFSDEPKVASAYVSEYIKGLHSKGIMATIKHFPGHGDTSTDTHTGFVEVNKTWDELKVCELITFVDNMNDTDMIMVSHICCTNVTSDGLPASLSQEMITGKLRKELGYDGVVITDGLGMAAIADKYNSAQTALLAVNAGVDILLLPVDANQSYQAIVEAVKTGKIPESRIDESVERILALKFEYGILD